MLPELTADDRTRYEWQLWVDGLGETGQRKLKAASVLISRVGGVGGIVAYYLAAAGVGRLILAHGGNSRLNDLNRQLLMTTPSLGEPRVQTAERRLQELNPHVEVVAVAENISEHNAASLVAQADVVACCAPLFDERLNMNQAAVRHARPLVDSAMFAFDLQLTTVFPGRSACLACMYPTEPVHWKREFPVFGAVAGVVGSMAAVEVIKLITGIGEPLTGKMLLGDLQTMQFQTVATARNRDCQICGGMTS